MAKEGGELQERGFMVFEKLGKEKGGARICANDSFMSRFCRGFIVRHKGQLYNFCVKKLQGLSTSSSAKEGSQNNSFSCQMSMTVPNSFLGS